VHLDEPAECHRRDHRCVAQSLELHVAAVLGALELDHDEVGGAIEPEEVDSSRAVLPLIRPCAPAEGARASGSAERVVGVEPML
jgi:hypothetical protein